MQQIPQLSQWAEEDPDFKEFLDQILTGPLEEHDVSKTRLLDIIMNGLIKESMP